MTEPAKSGPSIDAALAKVRTAIEAHSQQRSQVLDDTSAAADDFRTWRKQTIADLIGLPRLCHIRRCRRKRRCVVAGVPCIETHREAVAERLAVLLGYSAGELFEDSDDDLRW